MSKILKNQTLNLINLDIGLTIPASGQLTLTPTDYDLAADSEDIITNVASGDIIVNNGTDDLTIPEAVRFIQGGFTNKIKVSDDLLDTNRVKVDIVGSLSTTEQSLEQKLLVDQGNNSKQFFRIYIFDASGSLTSTTDLDLDGNTYIPVGPVSTQGSGSNLPRIITGSIDANGIATFSRDDLSSFDVDYSLLLDSKWEDGLNGNIKKLNGKVGIGTEPSDDCELHICSDDGDGVCIEQVGSSAGSHISLQASRGTKVLKTASQDGDVIGSYTFKSYDGSEYRTTSALVARMKQNAITSGVGAEIEIQTTPVFTTSPITRLRVQENGDTSLLDNKLVSLADPINGTDGTNKNYVDGRTRDNQIIVKSSSDLQNIDSSKVYIIDGKIDMGTQQIEVPSTGFFYTGVDYFVSSLFSTADNYTMFVNATGQAAGNVRAQNVEHYVSGTNSKVFDLDNQGNFGAAEFISCNFGTFSAETTSLGNLDNYRQFRTQDAAFIRIADGIEFNGTWTGGLSIKDTILLSLPANCTLFKEGTSLVFQGSVVSNLNALSVDNSVIVFDFQETNFSLDWGFSLDGARFNINSSPVPNILQQSTKRYFKNCRGVENTFVGGGWKLTTEVVTPLVEDVAIKINGVTTYNNLIHFSGLNNNELVYESNIESDFYFSGGLEIDGGPNDQLTVVVRKWDNSTTSYVDIEEFNRQVSNNIGGNDVAILNFATPVRMDKDDRLELWIINNTDSSNITLKSGSFVSLEER